MAKGGDWEREVAKALTEWASGQKKDYWFWRAPGSGSLATIKEQLHLSGDLIHIRDGGKFLVNKFVVECKNGYEKAGIFKIIKDNKTNELKDFWQQVNRDASETEKLPMLFFKRKFVGVVIGISKSKLVDKMLINKIPCAIISWKEDLPVLYLFDYKKFLEIIKPEDIMEL